MGSDLESLSSAATSEDDLIQWDEGAVYPEELPFSSERMVRNSNSGVVHFLRTPGYTACGKKATGYFSEFDGAKTSPSEMCLRCLSIAKGRSSA